MTGLSLFLSFCRSVISDWRRIKLFWKENFRVDFLLKNDKNWVLLSLVFMAQFKCLNVRSGSWRHTRQCLSPSHSHVIDLSPQHWAESIDFLKLLATVNPHWQQDVYLPGLLGPHYCPRCAKHWWLNNYVPDQLLFFLHSSPSLCVCAVDPRIFAAQHQFNDFSKYIFFSFFWAEG